jgi:hypothetical protein
MRAMTTAKKAKEVCACCRGRSGLDPPVAA